ncbi:hypothetical protein DFP72DRAFT_932715 [Ephemerocybe angulata]|uniref:MYND-type domain-containing protein n=1 Tax=Ephemerocybe angulata TaxID=980116 RepID=A0A8H6HCA7_9AGAR|nr:hypothetical protein DFP72DRAFT_932715 [Tulosesus angulatus]
MEYEEHERGIYPRFPQAFHTFRDPVIAKRRWFVEEARKPASAFQELIDYLYAEKDYAALGDVLAILEATPLPPSPLDLYDEEVKDDVQMAMGAVVEVMTFYRAFTSAPDLQCPKLREVKAGCFPLLVDHWGTVMKWLAFLLGNAHVVANSPLVLHICSETLLRVVLAMDDERSQEELVALPSTIDYVFLLLCQVNPETGKYYYCEQSGTKCAIIHILRVCMASRPAILAIVGRLKEVTPKTRNRIIASIIRRPRFIAAIADENGSRMTSAVDSIHAILVCGAEIIGDDSLWACFRRLDYLLEYTSALTSISAKAHQRGLPDEKWEQIAETTWRLVTHMVIKTTPNPTEYFHLLTEGGLIPCALRCLIHLPHGSESVEKAIDALSIIFAYLPVGKVWLAACTPETLDLLHAASTMCPMARDICSNFESAIELGKLVRKRRERTGFDLCCSLKHSSSKEGGTADIVRACSACKVMTYCSTACQKEDWVAFHSRECPRMAIWYRDRTKSLEPWYHHLRSFDIWTSRATRRDQLSWLEEVANEMGARLPSSNPPKSQSVARPRTARPVGYSAHSFITVIICSEGRISRTKSSLLSHNNACWRLVKHWPDARIQKCVRDMELRPLKYALVEGIFKYDEFHSMFVFVKMRYDADAEEGLRYRVVNSFFRLGPTSIVEKLR